MIHVARLAHMFAGHTLRSLFLGAVAVVMPLALSAQSPAQTMRISGDPTCATCRVEVTRLFTVGDIPGTATGRDSRIVRDSSGHYLVVVEPGPRIAIVDSAGRFLRYHEWRSLRADSSARGVHPFIDFSGWAHVFDGTTQWHFDSVGHAIGSDTMPVGFAVMGLGAVWSVVIPAPSLRPHRLFVMSRGWISPFPSVAMQDSVSSVSSVRDSVVSNGACRDCSDIVLNVSFGFAKGTLWGATADRYRINLYSQWGRAWPYAIDVAAAWLPLRDSSEYRPGRTLPEAPRISGIWFDQNGCTFLMTPDERAALARTDCERRLWVSGLTIREATASEESARYRTVIDVLGVTALRQVFYEPSLNGPARVIVRAELPGRVELFGPGLAYQHRALPNGRWALDVFQLSVIDR